MAMPPFLVVEDDTPVLDVAVGQGRERLALSDRAEALLVDELDYGNRDVVPWVLTEALALAGGLSSPRDRAGPLSLARSLSGAGGGRDPTTDELSALADYLRAVPIDEEAAGGVRELVRSSRLASHLDPEEITDVRTRRAGLRDIARDLGE